MAVRASGREAVTHYRVITRFRADQPDAPVLLFSGHADHELVTAGLTTLKVELLRKPFTGTELLARIAELRHSA